MALSTGPLPGGAPGPYPFLAWHLLAYHLACPPKLPAPLFRSLLSSGCPHSQQAFSPCPWRPALLLLRSQLLALHLARPLVAMTTFSCSPGPAPSLSNCLQLLAWPRPLVPETPHHPHHGTSHNGVSCNPHCPVYGL
uniref:Uncharacterized protein n=1 Tax=Pipistrellus kuhlii TaxID=59472 RepID=A0A7J7RT11_PIPKU|nr:hypothetical protein mPipKuh1_010377 [Pipistrellus kuhlii]